MRKRKLKEILYCVQIIYFFFFPEQAYLGFVVQLSWSKLFFFGIEFKQFKGHKA